MALRSLALSIIWVGILELSGQVHADSLVWDWTYSTTSTGTAAYVGSGTLTTGTTPDSQGWYTITGISGDWSITSSGTTQNLTITALAPPGQGVFDLNDNTIATSFPQLSDSGFSFADSAGNLDAIFLFNTGNFGAATGDQSSISVQDNIGTFTASVVPEPSPYAYALCNLLAVAGLLAWRRFSHAGVKV